MLNYQLFQKVKQTGKSQFNHSIITYSLLCVGSNSLLIGEAQHVEY